MRFYMSEAPVPLAGSFFVGIVGGTSGTISRPGPLTKYPINPAPTIAIAKMLKLRGVSQRFSPVF
jgi:hypothetical protein